MSIKMICSDLDGTILTYHQTELSKRLIDQIRELSTHKIPFVAASGRAVTSVQKLFEPVKDCCYYVCANGGVVYDGEGNLLEKTVMEKRKVMEIAHDFWENTDGRGEVNLTSPSCSYLMSRNLGMLDRIIFTKNRYELIEDPEQIEEDIVKVSVYLPDGALKYADRFIEKWSEYNAAIAGEFWIDTTSANKGLGIMKLCQRLGISSREVMAFGDNFNDASMLDQVGYPCIMETAAKELLQRYSNHVACVEDYLDGVLSGL